MREGYAWSIWRDSGIVWENCSKTRGNGWPYYDSLEEGYQEPVSTMARIFFGTDNDEPGFPGFIKDFTRLTKGQVELPVCIHMTVYGATFCATMIPFPMFPL